MIGKPKKSNRKKLIRLCDREMSLYVRERDKGCVICGSRSRLTCGHLLSRVAYSTRWHVSNCHCQCSGCNMRHEFDASPYTLWFIHNYSVEKYEELAALYHQTIKFKTSDLENILADIQEKRKCLT